MIRCFVTLKFESIVKASRVSIIVYFASRHDELNFYAIKKISTLETTAIYPKVNRFVRIRLSLAVYESVINNFIVVDRLLMTLWTNMGVVRYNSDSPST